MMELEGEWSLGELVGEEGEEEDFAIPPTDQEGEEDSGSDSGTDGRGGGAKKSKRRRWRRRVEKKAGSGGGAGGGVGGRKRLPIWDHFITTYEGEGGGGKITSNRCRRCGEPVSAKADRLQNHLAKCEGRRRDRAPLPELEDASDPEEEGGGGGGGGGGGRPSLGVDRRKTICGRRKLAVWECFSTTYEGGVGAEGEGVGLETRPKVASNKCRACQAEVSPKPERLKLHLLKCEKAQDKSFPMSRATLFQLQEFKSKLEKEAEYQRRHKKAREREGRPAPPPASSDSNSSSAPARPPPSDPREEEARS